MAVDTSAVVKQAPDDVLAEVRESRVAVLTRWLGMPLFLTAIFLLTYFWVSGQQLDSIEQRTLNFHDLTARLIEHVEMSVISTAIVIVLAVPLGVMVTRRRARPVTPVVLGLGNLGQAIPSFGLITLVVLWIGTGWRAVIIGLVAYSALPILRNTMVGLQQVDPSLIKAARGMGMPAMRVLRQIEMPLAVPVILAGVRTALILNVGTATLSTFFGVEGLGYIIFQGIHLNREPVLITGAVMASGLALLVDYLGGVAERLLTPRGL